MTTTLAKALQRVTQLFPLDTYKAIELSIGYTQNIYNRNAFFYKLLHSFKGSLHMTISEAPNATKRNHNKQIEKIAALLKTQLIEQSTDFKVLEIGCGKGYTLYQLAKAFPEVHFIGVDITPAYIKETREKVKSLQNVEILQMNMDELSFNANTFQLIYDIESACHSHQHKKLIANCYRILDQKGRFILFDLFRNKTLDQLNPNEKKILEYVELSVAIQQGIHYKDWLTMATNTGFKLIKSQNLSAKIIPGLTRFHKIATPYFKFPLLAKLANTILPKELQMYSIAAYLMKYSVESGVQRYAALILKK